MKKSLFALLSLMIVLSVVLGACGTKEAPAEVTEPEAVVEEEAAPAEMAPVTIAFWEQEGEEVDVFIDELIAEFEAAFPYITIERTHYENEALRDQFQTASLAEAAPEVVRVPNDFAGPFSELQIVTPITDLFDDAFLADFFEGSLGPAVVGGTLWGVPDNYGNHLMLLYNKALIAEAPATFEDLIAEATALNDGTIQGFAYNLNEPYWGAGFYGAFGGWPLDENDVPTFDNQAFIDYLDFVAGLKADNVVPEECDYNCADTLFKEGNAAMIINGDWSIGGYVEALGENLGTAPVPSIAGVNYTEMTAGKYYMVSNLVLEDDAKKAAVVEFITFMTSVDVQSRWLSDWSRLPSNVELAADPSIAEDAVLAGSMAALSNGRGQPAAAEMRCAWDAWRPSLEGVMAGTLTAVDAAASAQQSADECVATLQ